MTTTTRPSAADDGALTVSHGVRSPFNRAKYGSRSASCMPSTRIVRKMRGSSSRTNSSRICVDDAPLGIGGDEVAEAALVLDDFPVEQCLIALGHGVRVDSDAHGELAHRRDPLALVPLAGEDAVAHLVGDLLVDAFRLAKFHGSPASRSRATKRRTSRTAAARRSRRPGLRRLATRAADRRHHRRRFACRRRPTWRRRTTKRCRWRRRTARPRGPATAPTVLTKWVLRNHAAPEEEQALRDQIVRDQQPRKGVERREEFAPHVEQQRIDALRAATTAPSSAGAR